MQLSCTTWTVSSKMQTMQKLTKAGWCFESWCGCSIMDLENLSQSFISAFQKDILKANSIYKSCPNVCRDNRHTKIVLVGSDLNVPCADVTYQLTITNKLLLKSCSPQPHSKTRMGLSLNR